MRSKRAPAAPEAHRAHASEPQGNSSSSEPTETVTPNSQTFSKISKNANDFELIRKAVEDAASVSGGLWLSYLFVLFYIAVAAGAVTHADLLLANPVKLPFLNIELPLLAFFALAPVIFIIAHVYTLVHFVMLAAKVGRFHEEVYRQIPSETHAREMLRRQLPSNIFVQLFAGPRDIREGGLGVILKVIAWTTLVFGPVLLLLLLQIQFLPYHHNAITWMHRLALVTDFAVLWMLWPAVLERRSEIRAPKFLRSKTAAAITLCAFWFSWFVATFPGESHDKYWGTSPKIVPTWKWTSSLFSMQWGQWTSLHDLLFERGLPDPISRRPTSLFSSTLVLPGFNIYTAQKIDDPSKVEWRDQLIDLRGRDLKGAYLSGANLAKADLTGAQLEDAWLDAAQLQGAQLAGAQLQGAVLSQARLQGALLASAQLLGAQLESAQLQGSSLFEAKLQAARLDEAQLQGAVLERAQLQGASLIGANLQGASLVRAQLHGISFSRANLQGASFSKSSLIGADLSKALLWRTRFTDAEIKEISAIDAVWEPRDGTVTWSIQSHANLRRLIERQVPATDVGASMLAEIYYRVDGETNARAAALRRLEVLNCNNPSKELTSCNEGAELPALMRQGKGEIEHATLLASEYEKALARVLGDLLCSTKDNRQMLNGFLFNYRLFATGAAATIFVERVTGQTCRFAAELNESRKELLQYVISQAAQFPKDPCSVAPMPYCFR